MATESSEKAVVECVRLTKSFGTKRILDELNFRLPAGSITALAGPVGAGKTTLLKILAGLISVSQGTITAGGLDLAVHSRLVRRITGYVPSDERSFYWRLSGFRNLDFFASLHGLSKPDRLARIRRLLVFWGMEGMADIPFRNLSSGMKQILALCRGFIHDPALLLLDEPCRSLGVDTVLKVRSAVRDFSREKGRAVVWATHDVHEIKDLADRILILKSGRLETESPMTNLPSIYREKRKDSWDEAFCAALGKDI